MQVFLHWAGPWACLWEIVLIVDVGGHSPLWAALLPKQGGEMEPSTRKLAHMNSYLSALDCGQGVVISLKLLPLVME